MKSVEILDGLADGAIKLIDLSLCYKVQGMTAKTDFCQQRRRLDHGDDNHSNVKAVIMGNYICQKAAVSVQIKIQGK